MTEYTIEAFFVGVGPELDTDESNWTAEQAASLVGNTYGSTGSPLYQNIEQLTFEDSDSDGVIREDDQADQAENLTYGGGASTLDTILLYNVSVTFDDGSSNTAQMIMLQDDLGRMFLTPMPSGDASNAVLDDGPIRSIEIDSLAGDGYYGLPVNIEADAFVVCFKEGTNIRCPKGDVPIELLAPGDLVETLDHGPKPITWLAREQVSHGARTSPIQISKYSLGLQLPYRDLFLSPQHLVMTASKIASRMFGEEQVFVPAKMLTATNQISQCSGQGEVIYWHMLLERHEVLFAEGAMVESFLPGPMALAALSAENRRALLQQQPLLQFKAFVPTIARPRISGRRALSLLRRLERNRKPLLENNPSALQLSGSI